MGQKKKKKNTSQGEISHQKRAGFLFVVSVSCFGHEEVFLYCFLGYFVSLFLKDEKDFGFLDPGSEPIESLRWKIQNNVGMTHEAAS